MKKLNVGIEGKSDTPCESMFTMSAGVLPRDQSAWEGQCIVFLWGCSRAHFLCSAGGLLPRPFCVYGALAPGKEQEPGRRAAECGSVECVACGCSF